VAEYKVVFHREAERELGELYDYIADQAGAAIAWNFISGIRDFCIELTTFPERGGRQDHIRKGPPRGRLQAPRQHRIYSRRGSGRDPWHFLWRQADRITQSQIPQIAPIALKSCSPNAIP